jgi:hypothetical protein
MATSAATLGMRTTVTALDGLGNAGADDLGDDVAQRVSHHADHGADDRGRLAHAIRDLAEGLYGLGVVTGSASIGLSGRRSPRRRGLVHLVDEEVHSVIDAPFDGVPGPCVTFDRVRIAHQLVERLPEEADVLHQPADPGREYGL